MNNCEDILARLDGWLDGMLDPRTRDLVDRHIADCASCKAAFERNERLALDLAMLGGVADRMAAAAAPTQALQRRRWRTVFAAAAALMLAATLSFHFGWPWNAEPLPQVAERGPLPQSVPDRTDQTVTVFGDATVPSRAAFDVRCPAGHMAVRMKSSNPRIHIVWFYEETLPKRNSAEEDPGRESKSSA